ncbi:tetratricopeptide repeat protein [Sandarakinorhabdus sp.]|uniref:tetratricopeptide repeat protein n=1 Tax=Sandarakinorhabdus sp. TaxID=1916663 RepID=UPI00286DAFBC|nr:tetratricopeptide repeat protein [Sandarakinorhabdus sp.]
MKQGQIPPQSGFAGADSAGAIGATALLGLFLGGVVIDAAPVHARTAMPEGVRARSLGLDITSGDHFQTGKALLAAGNVAGALAAFRTAVETDPRDINALNGIGVSYDKLGRPDLARNAYEAALEIDPRASDVLYNLGYSLYRSGQASAAIAPLQLALRTGDTAVQGAARRVLTLVGDAIATANARANIIAPPAVLALAPEAATSPAAHAATAAPVMLAKADRAAALASAATTAPTPAPRIEVSSGGEMQLVMTPVDASLELAAALGEQAALVTVTTMKSPEQEMEMDVAFASNARADIDPAGSSAIPFERTAADASPSPVDSTNLPAIRSEWLAAPASAASLQQTAYTVSSGPSPLVSALLAAMDRPEKGLDAGWQFADRHGAVPAPPLDIPAEPNASQDAMVTERPRPADGDQRAPVALAEAVARLEELVAAARAAQA